MAAKPTKKPRMKPGKRPSSKKGGSKKSTSPSAWLIVVAAGFLGLVVAASFLFDTTKKSDVATSASPSPRAPVCENLSPALVQARTTRTAPYPMSIDKNATYVAQISTSCGTLLVKLFPQQAPIAVNNFVNLAEDNFYRGQVFHRIDRSLGIIQAGDPGCPTSVQTCGTGGPGFTIKDEFNNGLNVQLGTVAMASAGSPHTSGSQFEIVAAKEGLALPEQRTIFGQLIGRHSFQVAKLILSVPTKVAPNAPASAPADYSDGEFVYITGIKIIKKG